MAFEKIKFDEKGNPICEICGQAYIRLMNHVVQKHNMTSREYKMRFGHALTKGILNEKSRVRSIENAMECFFDKKEALWEKSRFFKKGHPHYPTAPHLRKEIIENANKVRHRRKRDEQFMQWLKKSSQSNN